jgi:hypothetical protein
MMLTKWILGLRRLRPRRPRHGRGEEDPDAAAERETLTPMIKILRVRRVSM